MKPILFISAGVFSLIAVTFAAGQTADSSASGRHAVTTDGELILDGNDGLLLPAQGLKPGKPADSSPVQPSAIPAASTDTSAARIPAPAAGQSRPAQVQKVSDEELILDGGEEYILGREHAPTAKKTAPVSGTVSPPDTAASGRPASTALPVPSPREFADSAVQAAAAFSAAFPSGKAEIEDTRSVNFARNLKEYRSPKLAMLMSLILPGSGQVYAKSNLWAAAFGAVEAAVIGVGFAMASKANRLKREAHNYANQHYDTAAMRGYLDSLRQCLRNNPVIGSDAKADSIYYGRIFSSYNGDDTAFFVDASRKNEGYYNTIGSGESGESSPYIRGWDDVRPVFTSSGFQLGSDALIYGICAGDSSYRVFLVTDTSHTLYGRSAHQEQYAAIVANSGSWADNSRTAFLSLLLNHIASSVMAGLTAKRHNDELLGKESFWHRVDLRQRQVFTGSETATGYALQVTF